MACNEVSYWKKTLMRRQFPTAKHSHPWIIKLASQLQEPISKHIVNVLMWTYHFGVQTLNGRTKKQQIVEVTSKPKFQQMLRACLGNEEVSLKRKIKGKGGKTDIIIDRKKPFTITYNSGNEVVTVKCHYGAWNSDDVPQFILHSCSKMFDYSCLLSHLAHNEGTSKVTTTFNVQIEYIIIIIVHISVVKVQHATETDLQVISIFLRNIAIINSGNNHRDRSRIS